MTEPIIENFASPYLSYIKAFGEYYFPDPYSGVWVGDECLYATDIHKMFESKLKKKEIQPRFTYDEYLNNEDIQNSLLALGLEIDKFWFFLLFIYDYTITNQIGGFEKIERPEEKANRFMKELAQALSDGRKVELKLIIEGQNRHSHLDSSSALSIISSSYHPIDNKSGFTLMRPTHSLESATVAICTFNELANVFFKIIMPTLELCPQTPPNYTTNISVIISRLVYFTGLTNNKKFLCEGNHPYIKDYLKKYKNFKIERTNNYYSS